MDIYVKGSLTRKDVRKAFFRHLQPTRNNMSIRIILVGIVLLVVIFAYRQGTYPWWIYLLALAMFIGVIAPWWLPIYQALTFNRNSPLLKPLTGNVTTEGVSLHGYRFNSEIKWSAFTHFKRTNDIVLLYQGPNAFNFLSRNLFKNDSEWEECITMVTKYLPAS